MTDLSELSLPELKEVAKNVGVSFGGNIGEDKLREKLNAHFSENEELTEQTEEGTVSPETPEAPEGMVKVKSIHNGIITVGKEQIDFGGPDDAVEVSAEVAEKLCSLKGYEKC